MRFFPEFIPPMESSHEYIDVIQNNYFETAKDRYVCTCGKFSRTLSKEFHRMTATQKLSRTSSERAIYLLIGTC